MSTQRTFPALTPSTRSYIPGAQPETTFTSQNGSTSFITFGNRKVDCRLKLGFRNLEDNYAMLILEHYRITQTDDYVVFDSNHGLGGMTNDLVSEVNLTNQGLKFRYSRPPEITSVFPGISNVECEFTGYLLSG